MLASACDFFAQGHKGGLANVVFVQGARFSCAWAHGFCSVLMEQLIVAQGHRHFLWGTSWVHQGSSVLGCDYICIHLGGSHVKVCCLVTL